MGEQEEADPHRRETRSLEPIAADRIARTFCSVAVRVDGSDGVGTAPTDRPPPLPESLPPSGRFTLVRPLGKGGMGQVEEVFDALLGRAVAQKTMLPDGGMEEATMLVAEAQTAAQLEHPSIVPVYDFGPSPSTGFPQYTMRLVRGRTLREVIEESDASTLAQRLGILRQVCLAVEYAHTRGVVHRDLKPENIVCGEFGEVYVIDWGIAHLVEGSDVRRTSLESMHAGSPGYMAPEQFFNGTIVPATDVFALGAILFEIVTGERAFVDKDLPSILKRCTTGVGDPPSQRNARVPKSFDALVMRCLAQLPGDRPRAREIADAIDVFLDGERSRLEREREAEANAEDGFSATATFAAMTAEAVATRERAEALLRSIPSWESADRKEAAWAVMNEAQELQREAAKMLARAQSSFIHALQRMPGHPGAREGLARLHYQLFEHADADGNESEAAQHLDLARGYDDGRLSLELANEGALVIETSRPASIQLARWERSGIRFVLSEGREVPAGKRMLVEAGSYSVLVRPEGSRETIRYPLRIQRAKLHRVKVRIPAEGEVPAGMVLLPGGRFLAAEDPQRATRMVARTAGDLAMSVFPVTLREYTAFLDSAAGRGRHLGDAVRDEAGRWRLSESCVEGDARKRIPEGRELDIPVTEVTWYDAMAYAAWRAETTGLPFRLPTETEWEHALRGADGRWFAMGDQLDPSFAKLRESRPESAQPEVVGAFPIDESPFGVRDLTGGVGDWVATMADGGPLPTLADEGTEADNRQAVWRGGCWSTTALSRHPMRFTNPLNRRLGWVGFRLCLPLDGEGSSELTVEPMRRS